jgi:hypothetical protein
VQCAMLRMQKLAYGQLYNLDKERRLLGCLFSVSLPKND